MEKVKVVHIEQFKKRRETYRYAALVMAAWDRREHREKRQRLERKAEVEREARHRW